jgi:hypothetical protein
MGLDKFSNSIANAQSDASSKAVTPFSNGSLPEEAVPVGLFQWMQHKLKYAIQHLLFCIVPNANMRIECETFCGLRGERRKFGI